jgi:predicted transcriptional regulator
MAVAIYIEEELARRVQPIADRLGVTLAQIVQRSLEELAGQEDQADIAELRRLSGQGNSQGWEFNRDEVYERS